MKFSTALLPCALSALASAAENSTDCNCDGCPGKSTNYLGKHTELDSDVCPEGSVATVTKLRTEATSGDYELLTWNTGGSTYTDKILGSPYKYKQATVGEDEEITCFELDESELPLIGDQRSIQVLLNCEDAIQCDFLYDVEFGCAKTGVLEEDVANRGGLQVLSDVDDTIKCPFPQCKQITDCEPTDIKHYLAGADTRLNDGEFYPGVAELMLGLALGPGADDLERNETFVPAKPKLLSARPNEFESLLGISQSNDLNLYFERVGRREDKPSYGVDVDGSMYGTIFDRTDHTEFGQTKARHYNTVSNDLPNTRFAFMGDNGQGDVCAAQSMLESDNGSRMVAVLIHKSQFNDDKVLSECQQPEGTDFDLTLQNGDYDGAVHFHETHSEAAAWALGRDLISCCSADKVYHAVSEWELCRCKDSVDCMYNATMPLPTGPYLKPSVRNEATNYCTVLAAHQATLADKLLVCDPERSCVASRPVPGKGFSPETFSAASARIPINVFAVAALLLGMVL